MPDKMVTDHWDMPSTPGMEFWIRGHAVSIFGFCYLMMCSPTASAAKAAFFISVGIGVLYPRIITLAKWGCLSDTKTCSICPICILGPVSHPGNRTDVV